MDLRRHGTTQESRGAWNQNVSQITPGETLHTMQPFKSQHLTWTVTKGVVFAVW